MKEACDNGVVQKPRHFIVYTATVLEGESSFWRAAKRIFAAYGAQCAKP